MAFDPLTLLILKYRGRSVAVFREPCLQHENLLAIARRIFPSLQDVSANDFILVAPIPGYPDPEPVELLPEIWTTIYHVVHIVTIALESEIQSANDDTTAFSSLVSSATHLPGTPKPTSLSSPLPPGPPSQPPRRFSFFRSSATRAPPSVQSQTQPTLLNPLLNPTLVPSPVMRGAPRKPVIYLYPPSSLPNVTVDLALTSSWQFSAVHPPPITTVPSGKPHTAQSLTWTVTAEPNGTLVDKASGMEVSYLYWEAIVNSQLVTPVASRSSTPIANTEIFDPARPSLNPGDSVLLPISKVPGYLDAVLKALALHTEARTSFITYWLPDMLKHEYIALRFVPQDVYERAAALHITPAPDVVTRVFMLFRGVAVDDLRLWEAASVRVAGTGAGGARFWADVVGVDAARAVDGRLFRVLEWGGMEVQ